MARVFLSYDRDNGSTAKAVARTLADGGHDVWWDQQIQGGAQFSKEIEQALNAADVVVVLWSKESIESPWVRDEAAAGRDRGRLVPLSIDGTEAPLGFRQYQTIALPRGRLGKVEQQVLLKAVAAATAGSRPMPPRRGGRRHAPAMPRAAIIALAALILLGTGVFLWKPWSGQPGTTLSVGTAIDDPASQALARDLTIRLGALQSSSVTPIRLVDASDPSAKPDLTFETAASGPADATLVLKLARGSRIMWSQDFKHPSGQRQDLLQQLAYTAGRIINCASEGLGGPVRLKPETLRVYLSACAQLSDMASFDLKPPLPLLRKVIADAPTFEPAWQALLLTEADMVSPEASEAEPEKRLVADLRRHIAEARKINPLMPAADIAEAYLLPPRDFLGRVSRIEQAAARKPDDPNMLAQLSGTRIETGRLKEAVDLAGKARDLDPLSPLRQANYIALLAYAGSFDQARRELAKAEGLWPGTASLEDAQYRFHLRYGDPLIARALFDKFNAQGGRGPRMLLAARQNPGPATIEPLMAFVRERLRNMENPSAGIGFATGAFAQFDRAEDFFETLLNWPKPDDLATMSEVFFRPEYAEERRDPRFMQIAERAGLLEFWTETGEWPDFCYASDKAYDCKAEAAKLH